MRGVFCWVIGHDWVPSNALTTFLALALQGKAEIAVYKCARCGTPGIN